jgi:hypothetical protein
MKRALLTVLPLIFLAACAPKEKAKMDHAPTDELWLMIKTSDYFRSDKEIEVEDELTKLIEGSGLGELDGHSSGAHQFELNFVHVRDFEKAKSLIESHLKKKHPDLQFVIARDYAIPFEHR